MIKKPMTIQPLLRSNNGLHLTIYLKQASDFETLRIDLLEATRSAEEQVLPVLGQDETQKFLEPLKNLLSDPTLLEMKSGHLALFRNQKSFRMLSLNAKLEPGVHLATSFHVKPLLRWIQEDKEYLVLAIGPEAARIYFGNQGQIRELAFMSKPLPQSPKEPFYHHQTETTISGWSPSQFAELAQWLKSWISFQLDDQRSDFFLVGPQTLCRKISRSVLYPLWVLPEQDLKVENMTTSQIFMNVQNKARIRSKRLLHQALSEFRVLEDLNLAQKNIFHIARAAVKGRIHKLIISDDVRLYGKIDKKNGRLSLHPFDLDHEDDDILDDLAQTVLESGGEVFIASQDEIPKGFPALAILKNELFHESQTERSTNYDARAV